MSMTNARGNDPRAIANLLLDLADEFVSTAVGFQASVAEQNQATAERVDPDTGEIIPG